MRVAEKGPAIVLLAGLLACAPPKETPPAAGAVAPTPAHVATTAADFQKLVGRWHRTDGDYTIEILGAALDGTLDARYFNPGPIHVSRAQARVQEGKLTLIVELRDRNYPGNLYTLTYDSAEDVLRGLYMHLGLQQTFDVTFVRERAS